MRSRRLPARRWRVPAAPQKGQPKAPAGRKPTSIPPKLRRRSNRPFSPSAASTPKSAAQQPWRRYRARPSNALPPVAPRSLRSPSRKPPSSSRSRTPGATSHTWGSRSRTAAGGGLASRSRVAIGRRLQRRPSGERPAAPRRPPRTDAPSPNPRAERRGSVGAPDCDNRRGAPQRAAGEPSQHDSRARSHATESGAFRHQDNGNG